MRLLAQVRRKTQSQDMQNMVDTDGSDCSEFLASTITRPFKLNFDHAALNIEPCGSPGVLPLVVVSCFRMATRCVEGVHLFFETCMSCTLAFRYTPSVSSVETSFCSMDTLRMRYILFNTMSIFENDTVLHPSFSNLAPGVRLAQG